MKKKTIWYLILKGEFNNSNFEDINEIYKNLITIYKFWSIHAILKFCDKNFIY